MNQRLTPKGKPKDGYYYDVICPQHRKARGMCIGKTLICLECADKGLTLSEGVKLA